MEGSPIQAIDIILRNFSENSLYYLFAITLSNDQILPIVFFQNSAREFYFKQLQKPKPTLHRQSQGTCLSHCSFLFSDLLPSFISRITLIISSYIFSFIIWCMKIWDPSIC